MSIEFEYRQEVSPKGIIYRPVAKVALIGQNQRRVVEYLYIDSGADFTLIPYKIGLYLGLDAINRKVVEVQGVNGIVGVIYHELTIEIEKYRFEIEVAWGQMEHIPLLLGRHNVFDKFEIIFREAEKRVIFNWWKG